MAVREVTGDHETVTAVLRAAAEQNGDAEAFVDGGERLTFAQWDRRADGVAHLLADRGVGRGDVVCLLFPSSIDYAVCYQAALRLGAVTSGINPRLGDAERASILDRLRPAVTVVDDHAAGSSVDGTAGTSNDMTGCLVERAETRAAGSMSAPRLPRTQRSDAVAVVWTSGSTGVPKGAVFDHGNLAAIAAGTDVLSQPGDRRLSPLPFAHVGYMTRAWDEIAHAVTTVITPTPWTAAAAIEVMVREQVTVGQGVPTQWALVLAHPDLDKADLSALRVAGTGAARVPAELVEAMRTRLGCPVVVRYTSTETALGTGTRPDDAPEVVATTVGRPVPGVELELVDAHGIAVVPGEVGRVRIRSGAVMRGYVAPRHPGRRTQPLRTDPSATAAVLDAAGWLTTGDLGWLGTDGNLRLVGRVAEMYIRGGYNVYPAEVEGALGLHPAVAEAAVVGLSDPVLGEIGAAFVVPAAAESTAPPTLEELREWCAARLADYKSPDRLYLVEALPLTAMAKVDKRALVTLAEAAPTEGRR